MGKFKLDKNKVSSIEKEFTKLIKDEIKRLGLIDTGSLYKSISTKIVIGMDMSLDIEISGNDYFEYLDDEYEIVNNAFDSTAYNDILGSLEELYSKAIEDSF